MTKGTGKEKGIKEEEKLSNERIPTKNERHEEQTSSLKETMEMYRDGWLRGIFSRDCSARNERELDTGNRQHEEGARCSHPLGLRRFV